MKEIVNTETKMKKIKMKCDYKLTDDKLVEPLLNCTGFCITICGAANSGKTNLLINLLNRRKKKGVRQSYKNLFDFTFIISPSLHTIDDDYISKLDDEFIYKELTEEVLERVYDLIDQVKDEFDEKPKILVVFDDVGNSIRSKKKLEEKFVQFIDNRRHANVSCILLLQNLYQVPPKVRNAQNLIFSFLPKTVEEEEKIFKLTKKPKKMREEFFDFVFREKHDFLIIDMSLRKSANYVFYRNFNRIEF
jgi:hypothetical protein